MTIGMGLLLAFHMPFSWWILISLAVVVGLFLLLFFIVCLWERQHLAGQTEPLAGGCPFPPLPYWQKTREEAGQLGLRYAGDFVTKEGTSKRKGLQSLFFSQDAQVIISIAGKSAIGMALRKTTLRSRLADGQVLESSDYAGIDDHSGVVKRKVLLNARIEELVSFHARRLEKAGTQALPFDLDRALEEWDKIDLERGQRWVLLGLAKWVDPQQTVIRMTFRGALAHVKNLVQGTGKLTSEQQGRSTIPRAGSPGY